MNLEINDRYPQSTPREFVERVVDAALRHAGRLDMQVSLLLTGEEEIATIHEQFMGDPTGTDVIAFPMDDGVDLVVSVERAQREAKELGHSFDAELALYIVHGILHVCGYDDIDAVDRSSMRDAERDVLASLGLRVTPVAPD